MFLTLLNKTPTLLRRNKLKDRASYPIWRYVSDLLTDSVASVPKSTTVGEGHQLMRVFDIPLLPVVDEQSKVLGVFRKPDCIQGYCHINYCPIKQSDGEAHRCTVECHISRDYLAINKTDLLADAALLLLESNEKAALVFDGDDLVGVLTFRDFVHVAASFGMEAPGKVTKLM